MELKAKFEVQSIDPKFGAELVSVQPKDRWTNDLPSSRFVVGNPTQLGALKPGDEVEVTVRAKGKSELERAHEKTFHGDTTPNVESTPENLKDKEPGQPLGPGDKAPDSPAQTKGNSTPYSSVKPEPASSQKTADKNAKGRDGKK